MTGTAALVPGISAAEDHCMQQGAREFFQAQGTDVLAELVRREGADPLTGDFRALAAPAACREPAPREVYNKRDGMHWMYMGIMPAELDAARFTGTLWAAIRTAGGPRTPSRQHRHFAGAFDPGWLASLPLPAGEARPAGQPVALLDARHEQFERHTGRAALARAYALRPRTRVLEDIAHGQPGTWHALAARHLTRLSGSDLHVTCSIFCSRYGDETFGRHRDAWFGAVVQMAGTKDWLIGECLLDGTGVPAKRVITSVGDILLLPKNLPHAVTTPADPGHSAHLAFAIDRDEPPP